MEYIYGSVTLNSGEKFRARQPVEGGKVQFMGHRGPQNASTKIAKSFKPGGDAAVPPNNRYRFADELENEHQSFTNSKNTTWKNH